MRWDTLVPRIVSRLHADTELVAALGGTHIYPASADRPALIPSVEWFLVTDQDAELFNVVGLQVDYWAEGLPASAQIERRLRALLHDDVWQDLNGERVALRYVDARSIQYTAEPGVMHRALDFEIEAVRDKYQPAE